MKRNREIFASSSSLFSIPSVEDEVSDGERSPSPGITIDASTSNHFESIRLTRLNNDRRTGLIFESSPTHVDRHNRFHKERPLRVESTRHYLLRESTYDFASRCILLSIVNNGDKKDKCVDECSGLRTMEELQYNTSMWDHSDYDCCFQLHDSDYIRAHHTSYIQRFQTLDTFIETMWCRYHPNLDKCRRDELAIINNNENTVDSFSHELLSRINNRLDAEQAQYPSVFLTPSSYSSAQTASNALCHLVSHVILSHLDNGFAIIRPPGHHAEPSYTGGYCILNHISIAAKYALHHFAHIVHRILIVDWDIHHGNGTQRIFFDQKDVLYCSVHRYHGGNFFPFATKRGGNHFSDTSTDTSYHSSGACHIVGDGIGKGYNVNVGWDKKGMGDDEYMAVWKYILMPIAKEFQPNLILISAGFDSAKGDMGECQVTPVCFHSLTRQLLSLAGGRVVCALEGGYVRSVLHKCVESVVCALLGEDMEEIDYGSLIDGESGDSFEATMNNIDESAAKSIRATIQAHQPFWKCLQDISLSNTSYYSNATMCQNCKAENNFHSSEN